jgi:peptide/nickel transport system substrate-binding protein
VPPSNPKLKLVVPLGAALALLFIVASAAWSTPRAEAQRGQVPLVKVPFPQYDGSLTPFTFKLGYPLVTLVYATLMWRDAQGVPRPWLARSVKRSADGRQLTVRLARGVRWHDGKPLTAADVAFTFEFVRARRHPRFGPQLRDLEGVDVVAPDTVVIRLRRPSIGFLDQPLADLPILPEHLWKGLPADRSAPAGLPVGTGPYRLAANRRRRGYVFHANNGYFRGRPAVRRIEVPIIRDASRTFRALERGDADMLPVSLPEDALRQLEGGPSHEGRRARRGVVVGDRRPALHAVAARLALGVRSDRPRG